MIKNEELKFSEQEIQFIKKELETSQYWHEEGVKVDILKKIVDFIDKPKQVRYIQT